MRATCLSIALTLLINPVASAHWRHARAHKIILQSRGARLEIVCSGGGPYVAFFAKGKLHAEILDTGKGYLSWGSRIRLQYGRQPIEGAIVGMLDEFGGAASILIDRLMNAKRLTVTYQLSGEGKRRAIFNLVGLRWAIKRLPCKRVESGDLEN